jgi:hypothetical protein
MALYYARAVPSARPSGDIVLWAFVAFLILLQLYITFTPAAGGATSGFAYTALGAYLGLTGLAALVERARRAA